jgi:hypothetical protein
MSQDLPQPTTSEHLAGPDERSARRARRAGGVALAVLALVAGGATTAVATSLGDPSGTSYGTVVDATSGEPLEGPIELSTGTTTDPAAAGSQRDCPKDAGEGSGTTPAPSPTTSTGTSEL